MDSYLFNLIVQYNFIFIYAYFVLIGSYIIKKNINRQIYAGFMFIVLYFIIYFTHEYMGLKDFPDSRYLILAFSAFFFGPISTIPIAIAILYKTYFFYNDTIIDVFIITVIYAVLYSVLRIFASKKQYKLRWYQIMIIAFSIPSISFIHALFFFTTGNGATEALNLATKNAGFIFAFPIGLTFIIFYMNNREHQRYEYLIQIQENEKDLLAQNMEIRALYEEMAASEEALRENYDELESYKDKIEYIAFHNTKTGIKNRDALIKDIGNAKSNGSRALLYMRTKDLNYYVNTLGQTLIEILHKYLGDTLREQLILIEDAELYELSEGRYCLLIDKFEINKANPFFEELNNRLSASELVENMQINLSLETGGVMISSAEVEASLWLEYSEIAMLESSQEGSKNGIKWFSKEMYDKKQYKTRLELDLQKAVENKELYIVYQPQYDRMENLVGAAALLRWTHKEYGNISPVIFIPLAETLGLIDGIGQFVMESVVDFIGKMKMKKSHYIPIAINISFLELINPDFQHKLKGILETHEVTSKDIRIEITETSISNQLDNVFVNINGITDLQIELHLDDFGTGYSSISHLSEFPINVIKIDKSFVDSVLTNYKIEQIILTIIELAHRINMQVIAEGVESLDQFIKLKQLGCDYYQGYYFAKPLSEEVFMGLIT